MSRQAKIVEMIQEQLQRYEAGASVKERSLYPNRWRGGFANPMMMRRTPINYVVLAVMAACVIG